MTKYPRDAYKFVKFEKGTGPKKYNAVLQGPRKTFVRVPFGQRGYQQYHDRALGLYAKGDHYDKARRQRYRGRHAKEQSSFRDYYSPGYFSWLYLWS